MTTASPYQFFPTPKSQPVRRLTLPDGREVVFSQVDQTFQAHIDGVRFPGSAIHVHINNSALTKLLGYAELDWQLAVIRRVTHVSLMSNGLHILRLSDWRWFIEGQSRRSVFLSI
jgi:hypothetical protein